jgi:hypothetical protein
MTGEIKDMSSYNRNTFAREGNNLITTEQSTLTVKPMGNNDELSLISSSCCYPFIVWT